MIDLEKGPDGVWAEPTPVTNRTQCDTPNVSNIPKGDDLMGLPRILSSLGIPREVIFGSGYAAGKTTLEEAIGAMGNGPVLIVAPDVRVNDSVPTDYPSAEMIINKARNFGRSTHSWVITRIKDDTNYGADKYANGHERGTFSAPIHVDAGDRKPLSKKQKKARKKKRRSKR